MSVTDEIKFKLDLIDVVSETVVLKKSGKSFTGLCPFHANTKTPSFVVFPETQTWRCFGACAEGGDIFSFVMKRDGYDFKQSLEVLAQQAGIQLQEPSPQQQKQDKQHKKLLELNAAVATYFHHLLNTSTEAESVRAYLTKRELSTETITTFQLGYALNEWDALKRHFIERGYTPEDLLAVGLIVEKDDGSTGYDRFRNRLIIPIRNSQGNVIGFGARALTDDQMPKYLNSPQTLLFDKSATLYGLDLTRQHIRQANQAVIVEGYMDVIQAYQRGAKNIIAQMGTALTEQQLRILKRTTSNFVLALDSDAAGGAATLRGLDIAREALDRETVPVPTARGLIRYEGRFDADIRIATLPVNKDPDDILKEGLDVWQRIIANAVPIIDFYFDTVTSDLDLNTAKDKSVAVKQLMPVLRDIGNNVEQSHYIQKLARLIQVDERTLITELNSEQKPRLKTRQKQPVVAPLEKKDVTPKPASSPNIVGLEEYCLSLVLAHPLALALANDALEEENIKGLTVNDFKQGANKELFRLMQLWTASEMPKIETLVKMVGESLEGHLGILADFWHRSPPAPTENINRDLSAIILRLRLKDLSEQIKDLQFLLREAEENKNIETAYYYKEMVNKYSQQIKELHNTGDALSLMGKRRTEEKIQAAG